MNLSRLIPLTILLSAAPTMAAPPPAAAGVSARYGLIGRMIAQPGKRDALAAILLEGSAGMPGCLSYIVANDPANPDAIWVTEAWTDRIAHDASLRLPAVQAAIARGRPLIASMDEYHETQPVGGVDMAKGGRK